MKPVVILAVLLALSGCGRLAVFAPAPTPDTAASAEGQTRPVARPSALSAPKPATGARTPEQFDTTTAAQRAAAAQAPAQAETALGLTVASLGDPARGGFWLETPLVSAPGTGRVVYPGTGQSAQVDLIPIDGPRTAGSRLSLAAMRLIGAPLAGLPEIEVYAVQ